MNRVTPPTSILFAFALAACGASDEATPLSPGLADGTPRTFAGRIELVGPLALEREGMVWIRVLPLEGGRPVLERGYDLRDPSWSLQDDARSLYFGLNEQSAPRVAELDRLRARMLIELRYEPDGDPETDEAGALRMRWAAKTGDVDLALRLDGAPPPASGQARAAPARQSDPTR